LDAGTLISELKRRRVFRVLVGYGLVAFAVLQIIEPVMHALHLADVTLTYTVLALALGLPIVVVLAWAFDVNEGRLERTAPTSGALTGKRLKLVLIGIGIVAATPVVIWYFVWPGHRTSRVETPYTSVQPSIAVLPFADTASSARRADGAICRWWRACFAQPLAAFVAVDISQLPGSRARGARVGTPAQWDAFLLSQVDTFAWKVLDQIHKARLFQEVTAHARAGPVQKFEFVEKIVRDVGVTAISADPRRDNLQVRTGGRHPLAHPAGVAVALLLRDSSEEDLFIRLAPRQ
jgi:hypothetical protein